MDGAMLTPGALVAPPYFDGDTGGLWAGESGESASENYAGKDGLTALVRRINAILNANGCVASWQDEGASKPTFFQLASGQCDPQFKYRMGQQNWLPAKLRLFAQPLGYASLEPSEVKTVSGGFGGVEGTAPVLVFTRRPP